MSSSSESYESSSSEENEDNSVDEKKTYITSYNSNIIYDEDTVSGIGCRRFYIWERPLKNKNKIWNPKGCKRHYIVGDDDIVYNIKGESFSFSDTKKNDLYYIINPIETKCHNTKDKFVLEYFKVRGIETVNDKINVKDLRFAGTSVKFLFQTKYVTFNDIFDLYEPENDIGNIELFHISQERSVFSYLWNKLDIPYYLDTKITDINQYVKTYDKLTQFSDGYDKVVTNPKFYNVKSYSKVFIIAASFTKNNKIALEQKGEAEFLKNKKKNVNKLIEQMDILEEKSIVKKYVTEYEKGSKLYERGKTNNPEYNKILKNMTQLEEETHVKNWIKLNEDLEKWSIPYKGKIELDDILTELKTESIQFSKIIFEEYLPENDEYEKDSDESDNESEDSNEDWKKKKEKTPSPKRDKHSETEDEFEYNDDSESSSQDEESLDLSDDSQDDNGEDIIDWDKEDISGSKSTSNSIDE